MMPVPSTYVHRVHFEDFDGYQFERLVFAYHARSETWQSLEWYGQTGSDLGRDIWGIREDGHTVCIQCANRTRLTLAKIQDDLAKVLRAANGVPDLFRVVASGTVSAQTRDRIKAHVQCVGVMRCDVWSGMEFEEFLRSKGETLLKRFVEGVIFPDAAQELALFAKEDGTPSDDEILAAMAKLFDRPAFYTPIHQESNLADFKQAITDTIQALGTGIWKSRDGHVIGRIPSRHQIKDAALSQKMQAVEMALARLRAEFDDQLKAGVISHCGCNVPDCPTYFMPSQVAHNLERLRDEVLREYRRVYPAFHGRGAW
ncbi:MAG: hypothetical protein ABSD72_06585 [Terracidiphilus sp.]